MVDFLQRFLPVLFQSSGKALLFGSTYLYFCSMLLYHLECAIIYSIICFSEIYPAITLSFPLDYYFFTLPHSQLAFWKAWPFSWLGASHTLHIIHSGPCPCNCPWSFPATKRIYCLVSKYTVYLPLLCLLLSPSCLSEYDLSSGGLCPSSILQGCCPNRK